MKIKIANEICVKMSMVMEWMDLRIIVRQFLIPIRRIVIIVESEMFVRMKMETV